MEELRSHRMSAADGKILFRVFLSRDDKAPLALKEKRSVLIDALALSAQKRYAQRLLEDYEQSGDRLKRVRTAPLIFKIEEGTEKHDRAWMARYHCAFLSCGRILYDFSVVLQYDEELMLFRSADVCDRAKRNF